MPDADNANSYYLNPAEYQKSIAKELSIVKDRIRFLLGNAHWPSEGTYKETILKNVIKQFLPKNLDVGSGFIVRYENETVFPSTQVDIIVYDTSYPLVFQEGDFIITTSSAVKGIIEVKSNITTNSFADVVDKASKLDKFLNLKTFNGIFSYKNSINFENENVRSQLKGSKGKVNHLCLGDNCFIKFWPQLDDWGSPNKDKIHYAIYDIPDYSFSYFVSNLIVMATKHDLHEQSGFLFTIPEGKDQHRKQDVIIDP